MPPRCADAPEVRSKILHDYSRFTVLTIDTFFQRILRAFIKELGIDLNYNVEIETASVLTKAPTRSSSRSPPTATCNAGSRTSCRSASTKAEMGHPRRHPHAGRRVVQGKNKDAVGGPVARGTGGIVGGRGAGRGDQKTDAGPPPGPLRIISGPDLRPPTFGQEARASPIISSPSPGANLKPYGATVARGGRARARRGAPGIARGLAPELQPLLREMCGIYDANRRAGTPATC